MKTLIISTPHSMAASTSFLTDRERAEILASSPRLQTSFTAFISAADTTGKPASITSTPISSKPYGDIQFLIGTKDYSRHLLTIAKGYIADLDIERWGLGQGQKLIEGIVLHSAQ